MRPPKKSWKNISNLSGGEKTLSSLSLVFALHHFKPTPLYVMDEIDAALGEPCHPEQEPRRVVPTQSDGRLATLQSAGHGHVVLARPGWGARMEGVDPGARGGARARLQACQVMAGGAGGGRRCRHVAAASPKHDNHGSCSSPRLIRPALAPAPQTSRTCPSWGTTSRSAPRTRSL